MKVVGLFTVLLVIASVNAGILKSKVTLNLLDSVSSMPVQNFTLYPNLTDAVATSVQGAFNARILDLGAKKIALTGSENFYAPFANVYSTAVSYDITNGLLNEVSRLFVPKNVGTSNTVISPNPLKRYVATSRYQSVFSTVFYLPHIYTIQLNSFDANGVINQTPSLVFNMLSLNPLFYNDTIAYNGICGVSDDGKYLLNTYALRSGYPGLIIGQKYAMMKVADDLSSLDLKATIDTAPTGIPSLYSFCQGSVMWKLKNSNTKYGVVIAEDSWNFTNILGLTAQISYYVFDEADNSFVHKASDWVSQYIQGYDVDTNKGRVYTISNAVSSDGVVPQQNARMPYDNPSVDKDSELRVWKLDENAETLTYKGGVNLNMDGIQVNAAKDGRKLLVTAAPAIAVDIFLTPFPALGAYSFRYGNTVVTAYRVSGEGDVNLNQESQSSASPLAFGLAFDDSCELALVCGQSTYLSLDGNLVGMKNTQLYEITDDS